MMISVKDTKAPHPWWFDGHGTPKRSMWLQSTLAELDEKTKAMLKLIETDADSFAQRAEMYYKKRPELISMVEDFYRTHRSLAERYDTLKSEPRTRLLQSLGFPSLAKCQLNKSNVPMEKAYDSYSETYSQYAESEVDDPELDEETPGETARIDEEESGESEIDDPEPEDASVDGVGKEDVNKVFESEIMKLKDEIERLKEENKVQKEQLLQKDEEKREVIRQLSSSLEILKVKAASPYKRSRGRESSKTWGPFEFDKAKGLLSVKLFG